MRFFRISYSSDSDWLLGSSNENEPFNIWPLNDMNVTSAAFLTFKRFHCTQMSSCLHHALYVVRCGAQGRETSSSLPVPLLLSFSFILFRALFLTPHDVQGPLSFGVAFHVASQVNEQQEIISQCVKEAIERTVGKSECQVFYFLRKSIAFF